MKVFAYRTETDIGVVWARDDKTALFWAIDELFNPHEATAIAEIKSPGSILFTEFSVDTEGNQSHGAVEDSGLLYEALLCAKWKVPPWNTGKLSFEQIYGQLKGGDRVKAKKKGKGGKGC